MKPYMIIEGSSQGLELFEKKVADALDEGYSLAGELIVKSQTASEMKFYQPVILADNDEDDWDEDEDEDEEDEDEDK